MNLKDIKQHGPDRKPRKRVGRGPGSGTGKTCGRGHKGAKARSGWSNRWWFEGGQMPLYRRAPKRGFSNFKFRRDYAVVNVGWLDKLDVDADTEINLAFCLDRGLVAKPLSGLKILGDGEIGKPVKVVCTAVSKSAREKIEAAGGSVTVLERRKSRTAVKNKMRARRQAPSDASEE